jgi:hypothetical protein
MKEIKHVGMSLSTKFIFQQNFYYINAVSFLYWDNYPPEWTLIPSDSTVAVWRVNWKR